MNTPFTQLVQSLPATIPFIAPETLERESGHPFKARIGANESAFGLSPAAHLAIANELERSAWYGDPENHDLRMALAELHGVNPNEICVDAGIDSLLGLVVRMLVEPGRSVVSSLGAYPTFNYHVAGFGGNLQLVPYRDDHEDPQALIDRAALTRAPLVYLSNPDNPMGTWHPAQTLTAMIAALPPGSVLALDEAYAEFAPVDSLPPIDTSQEQVIRLRTFSKAHGMAGLRVGYAIANEQLISGLNRIRNHFAVNRLAQAGALASLGDQAFLASVLEQVAQGRDRIVRMGQDYGLSAIASATNFVALDLGSAQRASALRAELQTRGVFVRMPGVAPLNRTIRIGVGSAPEQTCLETVFGDALAAASMRSPGANLMTASD
ncbi:MAG: aminotransferase class I/II-fold pyridoxal phosphate-dependent enzyme [Burkholderiaceae bacterium]